MCETMYVLGFISFDIVTGLLKGFKKGKLDSSVMRVGLTHKVAEFILYLFMQYLQTITTAYVSQDLTFMPAVIGAICLMETISVLENVGEVNPSLKNILKPYLTKLKNGDE